MFGIAIYLLMTQGSSHGIVWGGRYGNKLEGTLNGYGKTGQKVFPFQWEKQKM